MTVTNKYSPCAVGIDATIIGGITDQNLVLGSEVRSEARSGEIYARHQALISQKYAPGFTTEDVAAALGQCGAAGLDLSTKTLTLYAQKHAGGGTRAAGSVHRSYAFAVGILVPEKLTVKHQGDATISYKAITVSADGVASPMTIAETAALPTIAAHSIYTLGPAAIGAISLTHCKQFEIDFGIEAVSEGAGSDILDTLASISVVATELTLQGIDITWLKSTSIPETGKVATHANTTIYLRKRAAGGTFVADETAEHIKFTADGLAYIDQAFSGDPLECTLKMPLKYDGTNAPLVIDTASAIT